MRYCGQLSFKWAGITTSRVSVDGQCLDFSTCMKGEHQLFLFELVHRAPPLSVPLFPFPCLHARFPCIVLPVFAFPCSHVCPVHIHELNRYTPSPRDPCTPVYDLSFYLIVNHKHRPYSAGWSPLQTYVHASLKWSIMSKAVMPVSRIVKSLYKD